MANPEKNILEVFGENVRQKRKLIGLSQEGLAAKSDLHRTYIGMVERAEKNITLLSANKIANGLGVELTELFNDSKKWI